ncbi:MAG: hypothetical protein AAGI08_03925 [Bacteroidota bacterium]
MRFSSVPVTGQFITWTDGAWDDVWVVVSVQHVQDRMNPRQFLTHVYVKDVDENETGWPGSGPVFNSLRS